MVYTSTRKISRTIRRIAGGKPLLIFNMSAIKDGRYPLMLDKQRHLLFSLNVIDEIQDKFGGFDKLDTVVGRLIHTGNFDEVKTAIFKAFSIGNRGTDEPEENTEDDEDSENIDEKNI